MIFEFLCKKNWNFTTSTFSKIVYIIYKNKNVYLFSTFINSTSQMKTFVFYQFSFTVLLSFAMKQLRKKSDEDKKKLHMKISK